MKRKTFAKRAAVVSGANRRSVTFALCLAALMLVLSGCGGSNGGGSSLSSTAGAQAAPGAAAENSGYWDMDYNGAYAPESPMDPQAPAGGTESSSIYQNPGAKLIRRAEFSIQTERFDESVAALKQLTAGCGGYFEMASLYGGGRRDANANRWGEYTVRVPAEKYDQFFSGAGELGYVTGRTESSEDVGERYYDTEARLKTQRTKQERLLALLEKAESMEDIIALESALSEVEYQIEQYSSTLNRYDALIGFATFNITLHEVGQVTQEVGETASLGARMAAGVQSSFRGLIQGVRDVLIWASYNLFLVIILAAVAVVAVVVGKRKWNKVQRHSERKSGGE